MGTEIYIHYGNSAFDRELFIPIKNKSYLPKPHGGLWASRIGAQRSWADWCEAEDFVECSIDNSFTFRLHERARVLCIENVKQLKGLPYRDSIDDLFPITVARQGQFGEPGFIACLDFEQLLADGWDAVEVWISKDYGLYWALYGWDCDSIVVMNPDVIEVI